MNEEERLELWVVEMVQGIRHTDFYIRTATNNITEAAEKAEALRNDEDRFVVREFSIVSIKWVGRLED